LWQRDYPSQPHHLHASNSYASSTPAVDAKHVYVTWSTPDQTVLKAFDHDGQEMWSRDLGPFTSENGYGASPMVLDEMVILHHSQQSEQLEPGQQPGQSRMLAVDRQTGRDVWETPLKTGRVHYAVPFVYQPVGESRQLVCAGGEQGVFSLDPTTGQELWSIDVFEMRVCSSPILAGGHVLASNGSGAMSGNFIVGVKPGPHPVLAYKLPNSRDFKAAYVPCMIAQGDNVYLVYDRGFISSINAPTGKVNWCERTGGSFCGSPVLVDGRIYAVDEDGIVWVVAADPDEYRLLAKNSLGEGSRATPAISGGKMYLRTYSQLICVAEEPARTDRVGG
jgi:outer membrane protein assembly factor BamB